MSQSQLNRLLRPKSIAVVGGGAWCHAVVQQCRSTGFTGEIWPVHPQRKEIGGLASFRSVEELPGAPDATFIGVNRHATVAVARALDRCGAGGAVCFASGFLEAQCEDDEAAELQRELLEASGDLAILGPNCYGFLNYLDGAALWPDQHGGKSVHSGVAIITQSSNIAINLTMQKRALPIAYVVTTGNQAKLSLAEVGTALIADQRVTALGCHIEGFGDLAAFEKLAATCMEHGKPLLVLKVGKSERGRTGTISHTASLAGSAAGAQAFLDRLGIASVETLGAFLETLKLFHVHGLLDGNRVASLSCSGGEAGLVADAGEMLNTSFPGLGVVREKQLRQTLGPNVTLANPLDYHTYIWRNRSALRDTFMAMSGPDIDITMIVLDFPRADRCDVADWTITVDALRDAARETNRLYTLVSTLPDTLPEDTAAALIQSGIVPLVGIEDALTAIRCAARRPVLPRETVLVTHARKHRRR